MYSAMQIALNLSGNEATYSPTFELHYVWIKYFRIGFWNLASPYQIFTYEILFLCWLRAVSQFAYHFLSCSYIFNLSFLDLFTKVWITPCLDKVFLDWFLKFSKPLSNFHIWNLIFLLIVSSLTIYLSLLELFLHFQFVLPSLS